MVQGCPVPGSGYRIRCPAFGLDEGCGESRISLAPHPSMAEGRIPTPVRHRAPKTELGYRKTRTLGLHRASCILFLTEQSVCRKLPDVCSSWTS